MSAFFNQYSFLLIAAGLVIVTGLILLSRAPKWTDFLAFGVILASLVTAWIILHPRQTPLMEDARQVKEMIGAGTPVLLEFQSPYCLACTAIKPSVDTLERELGARLRILRLNVQEPIGRELAPLYGFQYTPTFIFFDAQGNELWRTVGQLDPQRVRQSLQP
ncbi:MAG: thioredoxin family protein [Anaerolineae bacterium]